jgi:hypothetical protein
VCGSHLLQLDEGLVVLALRPPQLGALQVELEALLIGAAFTGTSLSTPGLPIQERRGIQCSIPGSQHGGGCGLVLGGRSCHFGDLQPAIAGLVGHPV